MLRHLAEDPDTLPEPSNLRFLRVLVTILTATMIIGVSGILVMLFLRLSQPTSLPQLDVTLPVNVQPISVSYTPDWIIAVGDDEVLYVFDRSGMQRSATPLN